MASANWRAAAPGTRGPQLDSRQAHLLLNKRNSEMNIKKRQARAGLHLKFRHYLAYSPPKPTSAQAWESNSLDNLDERRHRGGIEVSEVRTT